MNILNKLSIKSLKLNKKRTISTIIGIILSTALICAVATMVFTFQNTLIQNAINETGYYHLKLCDLNDENIKELENNRDIDNIYEVSENGYGILDGSKNEYKPYVRLVSMDKNSFENLKFNLVEGRFSNNEKEIVISQSIIDNAKVNWKIGDKISLDIGKRFTLDDYELYSDNSYHIEDGEKIVNTKNYEFTIVGIISRPDYSFEERYDPGYTIITNGKSELKNVYISLKNPQEYKQSIAEIFEVNEYNNIESRKEELKYEKFSINNELLRWETFTVFSDATVAMLFSAAAVVIFVIIFTSVFCIRNSFAIATLEKTKMYGMLSSIGATKKQIKKSVIFEALILALIGIPLGILSGIFAVFVLVNIVNGILGKYLLAHVEGLVFCVKILPIMVSVVLSLITIYLSAISSARKASKISPIESLRNSNDIKVKAKKLKTPKIISKLFKTGGVLAYKNLKRSKKKYRTTVISISVSVFIFITINSFVSNMLKEASGFYKEYDYNIEVYVSSANNEISEEDGKKITSLDNIEKYFMLYEDAKNYYIKINDKNMITEVPNLDLVDEYYEKDGENISLGGCAYLQIYALNDTSFKAYAKKIGADYEKVKKSGILCDDYIYYDEKEGNSKEVRRYKYNKNDEIKGIIGNEEITVKVGAITTIRPYGIEGSSYSDGYLIVNYDEWKDIDWSLKRITIQSNDTETLVKNIKDLKLSVGITDFEEQVRESKSMLLVVNIFLYGFIAVITLIGVTNIFNTITSNIELRQKEFAMLKSIGMTKKEFNRMINLETLFYGTKSLIYGIILGLLGTFAMYKAFSVKIDRGVYIPYSAIIISIIFVYILVFVIMKYSVKKVSKQNIIETIRNDNV